MIQLTIDSNVINVRGRLAAMNTIEKWQSEGKVLLVGAQRLTNEMRGYADAKVKTMKNVSEPMVWGISDWGSKWGAAGPVPDYKELAEVLFPKVRWDRLNQNQQNDVMHLMGHCDSDSKVFITSDIKDFIKRGRRERLRDKFGIEVMTPEEFVAFYKTNNEILEVR